MPIKLNLLSPQDLELQAVVAARHGCWEPGLGPVQRQHMLLLLRHLSSPDEFNLKIRIYLMKTHIFSKESK